MLLDWEIILIAICDTFLRNESASPSPSLERQTWRGGEMRERVGFGADSRIDDDVDYHHGESWSWCFLYRSVNRVLPPFLTSYYL